MKQETNKKSDHASRKLARLAAVQGLYQAQLSGEPVESLIRRFRENPAVLIQEEQTLIAVDADLFSKIVTGVAKHGAELDSLIAAALDPRFSLDRLEPLLKGILRAGAFELWGHADIPSGVVVNDYVDVAHGFFDVKEPGLVNAVLDAIGKKVRS